MAAAGASSLIEAVKSQDAATVRALLKRGADVNAAGADGSAALHFAAQENNLEIVNLLLAAGAKPSAVTRYNITPLSLACTNGNAAMIARLLAAGADPNSTSREAETALMTAARNGNVDAVKSLLVKGAKPNVTEPWKGQTALMWAAGEGNAAAAEMLTEFGADVKVRSKAGFTAFLLAVRDNHIDAAKVLLQHGASVNETAPDGTSALNLAIVNAYYDLASVLLDFHADPNLPDPRASPLHTLAWLRRPGNTWEAAGLGEIPQPAPRPAGAVTSLELAQKLIDHGADVHVRVSYKEMPMSIANGAARNPPDIPLGRHPLGYVGATAFYVADRNGDPTFMRMLVKAGADPNVATKAGVTPLMAAAGLDYWEGETPGPYTGTSEAERLEAVKLALELGNDINAHTDFGVYPMIGTAESTLLSYPKNIEDLLDLGVGDPRFNGSTALHGAVISNQPSIVQYLIDHGADIDAKNQLGWTALMISRGIFVANNRKDFPAAEKILLKTMAERAQAQR
jgi:ankyrin repeat protein